MMPKLPDLEMPSLFRLDVERLLVNYGRAVAEACAVICEDSCEGTHVLLSRGAHIGAAAIREAAKEIGK